MEKRHSITTQGKQITFNIDKHYYVIGDSDERVMNEVFWGDMKDMPYAVAYTKVMYDKGYNSITLERYDNGYVGYQNFNYHKTKDEAVKDYEFRSKLSDDFPNGKYADVFIIENPSLK